MNDLRDEHATVNDAVESVLDGNVKLQYNETADFVRFSVVGEDPGTPDTVLIQVGRGAMKVIFDIPDVNTSGCAGDPAYSKYWKKLYFADGSYLAYFPEVTWSSGDPVRLEYMGGVIRFYQKTGDTYTMSDGGTWGTSITSGIWVYWVYDTEDNEWVPQYEYYTKHDKLMYYIWFDPGNYYLLGYGVSGIKIGDFNVQPFYGTANKNMPIIQWAFVNGWQELYDYLAGEESSGTHYPGEDAETGGGNGDFYNQNDNIDYTPLPSLQAINLGFTSLYNPHEADVKALARWMWSDDYTDNVKMNLTDPLYNILGINFCALPEGLIQNERSTFVVGYIDSGINTYKVSEDHQYIDLDCGELTVPEYWANFLDYNTNFQIWLPYIGFRQLKPEDILKARKKSGGRPSGSLGVKYHIDLMTGCAVCEIRSIIPDRKTGELVKHVLYSYNCNVFYSTPLSGANFMGMYNQQLSATVSGLGNMINSIGQVAKGDIVGGLFNFFTGQQKSKMDYDAAKPDYGRSGNSGGSAGYFSYKKPYIVKCQPIGQTPNTDNADQYAELHGIPLMKYYTLSDLEGYTEINTINLDSLNASSAEKSELLTIMKSGFYI